MPKERPGASAPLKIPVQPRLSFNNAVLHNTQRNRSRYGYLALIQKFYGIIDNMGDRGFSKHILDA